MKQHCEAAALAKVAEDALVEVVPGMAVAVFLYCFLVPGHSKGGVPVYWAVPDLVLERLGLCFHWAKVLLVQD